MMLIHVSALLNKLQSYLPTNTWTTHIHQQEQELLHQEKAMHYLIQPTRFKGMLYVNTHAPQHPK